jgi:hypothetical protein
LWRRAPSPSQISEKWNVSTCITGSSAGDAAAALAINVMNSRLFNGKSRPCFQPER